MKRTKRNVFALLGWYDHRILRGIARFAREAHWHLPSRHLYDVTAANAWKGDGVLTSDGTDTAFQKFIRRQVRERPTVLIGGGNSFGVSIPQVSEDNVAIGQMAARHFLERGYRNFAGFSTQAGGIAAARLAPFRQGVAAAGLDCTLVVPDEMPARTRSASSRDRRSLARRLMALPKPLALFAVDDQMAADVVEACVESDIAVPQNVAVLGVGNLEIACECSYVPISSIEIDFEEMGYRGAQMLEELMSGAKAPLAPLILPPISVAARRSTDLQASMQPDLLRAVQFIKDNFRSPLHVHEIAEQAAVSSRTLSYLFAHDLRQSPGAYLQHVRLEHAKTLLRETDQKVRQIAETCGFESERNLQRAFRREAGLSPMVFRQRHRVIKTQG